MWVEEGTIPFEFKNVVKGGGIECEVDGLAAEGFSLLHLPFQVESFKLRC